MPKPEYARFLIAYDIPSDRRRTKVSDLLCAYGTRVNDSVFEITLKPSRYLLLKDNLNALIKPKEDSVRIYPLCQKCVLGIETLGDEIPPFTLVNTFL
ncbi:MAG: CRISPR-associated endonuclease Cas2 [Sulfuricurvum sp.]